MTAHSLGWSPSGVHSEIHLDDTDRCVISHTQPGSVLDRILDENHEAREAGRNRIAESRLVGSVPWTVYLQWRQEWEKVKGKVSEPAFMMRKLADAEYAKLRLHATPGDLIMLSKR